MKHKLGGRAPRSASGTLPFVFTSRSCSVEMFWRH